MLYNIVQSGIAIFSLYSLRYAIDMNISKQISKSYGKSVILENLNSVKFSIHEIMRKMNCRQNETILYYGNYGKTRISVSIWAKSGDFQNSSTSDSISTSECQDLLKILNIKNIKIKIFCCFSKDPHAILSLYHQKDMFYM